MEISRKSDERDTTILLMKQQQVGRHKKIAFFGVAISTVATVCSVIVIPLLYYYIQTIQTTLTNEIEFCRQRSRNMWKEYASIEKMLNVRNRRSLRNRRQSDYYFVPMNDEEMLPYSVLSPYLYPGEMEPQMATYQSSPCCKCGIGEAGEVGLPGPPGDPGTDGLPGRNGQRGPDPAKGFDYRYQEWCFDCPQAPPGPPGLQGPKGYPGQRGIRGADGLNGVDGLIGPPGEPGKRGPSGSPGLRGQAGEPGEIQNIPGKKGERGQPGLPGPPGPDGENGYDGKDGLPGPPGLPGDQGPPGPPGRQGLPGIPGSDGHSGEEEYGSGCDHCPLPRLESG